MGGAPDRRERAVLGAGLQDRGRPLCRSPGLLPGLLGQDWHRPFVLNSAKGKKERIGRLLQMHANHREDIQEVYAGDIAAIVGLKDTFTGDTLCDPTSPIILESIKFPEPVISIAVEPKTKIDQDKMDNALMRLAEEDPTFKVRTDEDTGQVIISGMGELHLEVILDRRSSVAGPGTAIFDNFRIVKLD